MAGVQVIFTQVPTLTNTPNKILCFESHRVSFDGSVKLSPCCYRLSGIQQYCSGRPNFVVSPTIGRNVFADLNCRVVKLAYRSRQCLRNEHELST